MSAILFSKTDTAIEILADGAVYDTDGTISGTQRKIRVWPEHGVAAATRGPALAGPFLLEAFGMMLRQHDLYGAVRAFSEMLPADERISGAHAIEFTIAGYQGSKPAIWYMVTRQVGDYEPFIFYEIIPRFQGGAMGSPDTSSWAALGVRDDAPDDTLFVNGERIMEAFRHLPGPVFGHEDQPGVYGVGGHVQYVRLEPDGDLEDVILKTWPDMKGEKIEVAG